MNTDELFISSYKLPKPLSKQEVNELLDKIKQGYEQAIAKLAEHNIRLVLYEVTRRFNTVEYDKNELVSIGNVGLMKAITTFDTSKKVEFATYATRCIDNEILMFLRKLKKVQIVDSLDTTINHDKDGNELKIEDTLSDDTDIVEEYNENETHIIIREIVKKLPDRDRDIIMLHFGFCDDKMYTQREIANIMSLSQSYVSRLIKKVVKLIGKQLAEKGIIELKLEQKSKTIIKFKNDGGKQMAKELKSIYEYFNLYTKEQVDEMLKKLTEEETTLIILRYGEDLNNPVPGKLNKEQTDKFYGCLIPKMKRLLANPDKELKPRKRKTKIVDELQKDISEKQCKKDTVVEQTIPERDKIITQKDTDVILESLSLKSLPNEEYLKMLEFLKNPSFSMMISMYSPKEAIIVSLKLGFVDGKCFSTAAISEFLGIEQQEVIDITRKVLLAYKEKINQTIDGAIQLLITEAEKTLPSCIDTTAPCDKTFAVTPEKTDEFRTLKPDYEISQEIEEMSEKFRVNNLVEDRLVLKKTNQ